ncbi:MAG: AI-2E family transporter [Deltaproteobacteria bacterium]|nr:AI-2E family transporter [Deltaproteobacteria bacterium]
MITPPTGSESNYLRQILGMLRWLLILLFIVLGWVVVSYMAGILGPILAALGIAYLLNPVLEKLVKQGVSRTLGAGILLISFLGVLIVALALALPAIADQIADFVPKLPRMVDNLADWLRDRFGIELPPEWQEYARSDSVKQGFNASSGPIAKLAAAAVGGVFSMLAVFAEMLLVPVFAFYFLVDWPNLLKRISHMIPPRRRSEVREVAKEVDRVVAGWVRGQAIVTSILAVLYAIGFTLVGMPLSVPIGLLVGALTIIPFVGTFVGAGIAAMVTLVDGGSLQTLGLVGVVIFLLHLLEAGVLTPKIVGHRVGLSESGALIAVIAGGKLLGFVGVVLAVPLAATFAVLVRLAVRYYEHTSFFGHESDADVVITPAMALIMPGVVRGAKVVHVVAEIETKTILEKELDERAGPMAPELEIDLPTELGPSGRGSSEQVVDAVAPVDAVVPVVPVDAVEPVDAVAPVDAVEPVEPREK